MCYIPTGNRCTRVSAALFPPRQTSSRLGSAWPAPTTATRLVRSSEPNHISLYCRYVIPIYFSELRAYLLLKNIYIFKVIA